MVALYNAILCSDGDKWKGPMETLLFDIIHRLDYRVHFTKLVELDEDICPYLATLMATVLAQIGEALAVPKSTIVTMMTREAADNMLMKKSGYNYANNWLIIRQVLGLGWQGCLKRLSGHISSALSSGWTS